MTITSRIKPGRWISSHSPDQTRNIGDWLGKRLKAGSVLSLCGSLGSGKTTFAKGLAQGLGLRVDVSEVVSPTFVLVKEYPCRIPLYHIDLYRLEEINATDGSLLGEYISSDGITVLEWGEKAEAFYPLDFLKVEFQHEAVDHRRIRLCPQGSFRWLKAAWG